MTIPVETLGKIFAGGKTTPEEEELYASHAVTAAKLVGRIPRLDGVARIIAAQNDDSVLDGGQASPDEIEAAAVLRAVSVFDLKLTQGMNARQALAAVAATAPKKVVQALSGGAHRAGAPPTRGVTIAQLRPGMVLEDDVKSASGVLLMSKGQTITETARVFLTRYDKTEGVEQPFRVQIPQSEGESEEQDAADTTLVEPAGVSG